LRAALALLAVSPCAVRATQPPVSLPARLVGNMMLITVAWDEKGPWTFLIDTGSSVTVVTEAFAAANGARGAEGDRRPFLRLSPGHEGESALLRRVTIPRIRLATALFRDVPALVGDAEALSAHMGVRVDGILGFPVFADVLLTLDYPGSRVAVAAHDGAAERADGRDRAGTVVAFDNSRRVPLAPVRLDGEVFAALLDSGNDGALKLNPAGMRKVRLTSIPRRCNWVATLSGNRVQKLGRLANTLELGGERFERPIVEITGDLSSVGCEILKHFRVTFDQRNERAVFFRGDARAPVTFPPVRNCGVVFSKSRPEWRVAGLRPGSDAGKKLALGDRVTALNGEPVAAWPLNRFLKLIENSDAIDCTVSGAGGPRVERIAVETVVE
jgi:hypothetical protein